MATVAQDAAPIERIPNKTIAFARWSNFHTMQIGIVDSTPLHHDRGTR